MSEFFNKFYARKEVMIPIFLILPLFLGFTGTVFTNNSLNTWYADLNKPFFTPPNWMFAPVWTIIYFLMGVSAYLVWKHGVGNIRVKKALKIFWMQLGLNLLWTPIFFGLKNTLLAFLEILILDISLVYMIKEFYKVEKKAAYLQTPYVLWLILATLLNLSIYLLN